MLVIFIFGGTVLFNVYVEPGDFEGEGGGGFVPSEPSVQAPQTPTMPVQTTPTVTPSITSPTTSMQTITTMSQQPTNFQLPSIAPTFAPGRNIAAAAPAPAAPSMGTAGMTREIATGIAGFSQGWAKGAGTGSGTGVRSREFEFTAYVAKYSGGNWNSTVRVVNNKIVFGSLPNLLYIMQFWSRDKIKANPNPVPLDLASDQIFAVKPPFIFFTGHRDFKLSDKEVENLRKYIRLGGAIWGDSSVPGQRSRFDIAFRREMKRVVADKDKEFEPLPPNHAIYNERKVYFPEIREVPHGINFYKEPVYALKVYDEIAVLYTANDYGDMWQMGLDKDGKFDTRRNDKGQHVAMNIDIFNRRDTYFRGISEESVVNSYKFGTNIVLHLLTRWEDKLRSVPRL